MPQTSAPEVESQHFQHYTLKHRIVSWISRNLFDGYTYTVRHGLLTGMKRRGGLGWMPAMFSRSLETPEYLFWKKLPLAGLVVYDVGSFEGLLALFFASQAKQVVCYEPNSRNHARLKVNLELNNLRNVIVRNMGAGETAQEIQLVWNPAMPGGASAESATSAHLRETVAGARIETIPITTLDEDIVRAGLPAPDLIKVDIEGWELQALRGAKSTLSRYFPALYLEMHGETMAEKKRKVADLVAFLEEVGYPLIEHVETGTRITSANSAVAVEGHLYCPRPAASSR